MRRKDREITDRGEMLAIMHRCDVCHLAFAVENTPYVVPMNFGIMEEDGAAVLVFHCAGEGRKLEMMDANAQVAFSMSANHRLEWQDGGSCTMRYESVCGTGLLSRARAEEKLSALGAIMDHYRPEHAAAGRDVFPKALLNRTTILKLKVAQMTGKRSAPAGRE